MKTERMDLSFYANRGEFNRNSPPLRKEKRWRNESRMKSSLSIATSAITSVKVGRVRGIAANTCASFNPNIRSLISIRRGDGRADICRDRAILVICQLCCIRILQVYAT